MTFDQAKQRADKGDAFAQAVVAMHYQIGWETEKNVKQAARYAHASAKAKHALGLFRVGTMLRNGEGFSKDEKKGLELQGMSYKALKDAKDPYSITATAIMIFQGKVAGQSIDENERRRVAAGLYKQAADMGFAPAQFNYAMALNDGHGVSKNPALFQQYLAKAQVAAYPLAKTFQSTELTPSAVVSPTLHAASAEACEIESLIDKGDLKSALSLAEKFASATQRANLRQQAEAQYSLGIVLFLLENYDDDAEQSLKRALSIYQSLPQPDPVGHWKTLSILESFYLDHIDELPRAWEQFSKELYNIEGAARRVVFGLPTTASRNDIYKVVRNGSPLLFLDEQVTVLAQQLSKHPTHGDKIAREQIEHEDHRNQMAETLRLSHGQRWDGTKTKTSRLETFRNTNRMVSRDLQIKQTSDYLEGIVQHRLDVLSRTAQELSVSEPQKSAEEAVEGFNGGERWAYEFIEHKVEPTTTLATDSAGLIAFADANLVVRSAEFRGTVAAGSIKTELSFYDTRCGKLRAVIALPNRVFQIGRVDSRKEDLFYIGTVTAAKYCYDDYPLALTLVDLEGRKFERIPLVQDDYWLALNNDVKIASLGNQLLVKVQPGLSGQYISNRPTLPSFRMLQVAINETPRPEKPPYHHDINKARHVAFIEKDRPALSYLGAAPIESKDPAKTRGDFAVGSAGEKSMYPRVLKLDDSGHLGLIDLMDLKAQTFSAGCKDASNPHIFGHGSLACVAGPYLHLFRGQEVLKISLPRADERSVEALANANNYQPRARMINPEIVESGPDGPAVKVAYSDYSVGYQVGNEFFKANIPDDLHFSRVTLGDGALAKMREGIRRGSVKGLSDYLAKEILKKSPSDLVRDWEPVSDTFVVSGDHFVEWFRIDAETGEPIGPSLTGGAKGFYDGIKYSNTCGGWRAYSFINDSHTGGYGVCLNLEQVGGGRDPITVAHDLPNITEPLSIQTLGGKCLILYGAEDSLSLVAVNLGSGEQKPIKAWRFPARFGKALCDHNSGTLFIPTAAGFEVWSIWNGKPTRRFDLVLGDEDQYAILLPNGIYAGSPGCEGLLRLKAGNGMADGSTLASWRNRPAEVLKALGGDAEQIEILAKVTERWLKRIGHDASKPEPTAEEIPAVSVEMPPLWAKGSDIEIPIKITPKKTPISNVLVRVNGVECANVMGQFLSKTNDGNLETVVSLRIAEGQNWIEVTAIDEMGRRSDSQRFRTILKEAQSPRRYVVALGVSKYHKSEFDLAFAAKDAKDLTSSLSNTDTESLILTDDEVDGDAIGKIQEFLAASQEDDEVILFCAGHGVLDANLDYVFARHDFDPDRPNETGIKLDDLIGAVGAGKSLKRLILLDTCHSGMIGEKEEALMASADFKLPDGVRSIKQRGMIVSKAEELTSGANQRFIEELFMLPGTHRGVNIIGASGGAEYALESGQWNNGVFTASVIEGLRDKKADWDKDEDVSVSELRDYLGQRIPELTGNAQKPSVVAFERDQDFNLVD